MQRVPDVVVLGGGYVGLTLAVHLAAEGRVVSVADIDASKIKRLQLGEPLLFEEGLRESLATCVASGRLDFDVLPPRAGAPVWVVAVPYLPAEISTSGAANVVDALRPVRGVGTDPPLIMFRSTVPVGYTRRTVVPALSARLGALDEAFFLSVCPERTLTGAVLRELGAIPQLVGGTPESVRRTAQFLERCRLRCEPVESFEAAELAKLLCNFNRTVQFNLANFVGLCCQRLGVDHEQLWRAVTVGYDRISLAPPGPGIGGFCLPKDCLVFAEGLDLFGHLDDGRSAKGGPWDYPRLQYRLNEAVIDFHVDLVASALGGARRILALGLAFKGMPRTDDIRGSVGVVIVRELRSRGWDVHVYDRTVGADKLEAMGWPVKRPPYDLSELDAVLLLNNDPAYLNLFGRGAVGTLAGEIVTYDPWSLLPRDGRRAFVETVARVRLSEWLQR